MSKKGLDHLAKIRRLDGDGKSLRWKMYETEAPGKYINNIWGKQMSADDLHYIVETAESVIERCILMTTNPGDLVMDPTCGSGTTAYVAEKWGRRWITSDSSIVAITLARQRIITGIYEYYTLQNSNCGERSEPSNESSESDDISHGGDPSKGFIYKTADKISAKTLAYDERPPMIELVNKPLVDKTMKRVSSPFTVESHSPYRYVDPELFITKFKHTQHTHGQSCLLYTSPSPRD